MRLRFRHRSSATLTLGLAVLFSCLVEAQQPGQRWEVLNKNATGGFIVALAEDLHGNVWVGTEDKGVFRYDPKANQWTQFNSKNGLADDNAYAIACDKLGRVWVGTLNKGVSVFNGEKWQNYDVLDGPIGERIFAITTCPTDGDVWMATSAGLSRYSLKSDTWSYVTRADGLPEDQANAIAFDPQGNIYVGTQCHGIAIGTPSPLGGEGRGEGNVYKKWTVAAGPAQLPVTPTGTGLPTSLINALLVNREGTIFAGTTAGLAWSKDKGKTWSYLRGRDYDDKVKGRWGGPPPGWQAASKPVMDTLLPEDYVTCLAEDDAGLLWLGFRRQGYVAIDPKTSKHVFAGGKKADGLPDDYVFTILPIADLRPFVGTYGGGLGIAKAPFKSPGAVSSPAPKRRDDGPASCPSPAAGTSLAALKKLIQDIDKALPAKPQAGPIARALADDWRTQGDFYGEDKYQHFRYGEMRAVLCSFGAPSDAVWGAPPLTAKDMLKPDLGCYGRIGSHATRDDALRHWVHWKTTDNPRCLKNPFDDRRRQAEWDDHKEAYPLTHEGPGLYIDLEVPQGTWYLSFYFMNKDGHDGNNRLRDYLMTIKPFAKTDVEFAQAPVLARARVRDFWGGVYKTFVVPGDRKYTLQIHPNWSFNTIVSGVFLDPVFGRPKWKEEMQFELPIPRVRKAFTSIEADGLRAYWTKEESQANQAAITALGALEQRRFKDPIAWAVHARPHYLGVLRTMERDRKPSGFWQEIWDRALAECYNQLRLFVVRDELYNKRPAIPSTRIILDKDQEDK